MRTTGWRTPLRTLGLLMIVADLPAHAAGVACADLKRVVVPGMALEILQAENLAAAPLPANPFAPPGPPAIMPAHCHVQGVIDRRVGVGGKPYSIGFALALPPDWNGRFLFQGGGGLNGSIAPPLGATAAGDTGALSRGFAVVSTDSGHSGAVFDGSFFADQEAALNFLYQAVAKVTLVAKQVITAHYGKVAHHSYFVGCSTGGREAMLMSQRFPHYFDGIVAGAPAMRTNYSNLALRWVTTALNSAAPKGPDGQLQTAKALSDADRKLVIDGLLNACDALDGAKDGMVFATRQCGFDPALLVCKGNKKDTCLSAQQVVAVKKAFAGPKSSDGRQVYPGFPYDTGIATTRGIPGLLITGTIPEGPRPTGTQMNVDAEAAVAHDAREMLGDSDAWTNLSSFRGHGGKLIFFHGVSDPWFSALETVRYYEQLSKDNGPAPIADWTRLFLVPGMAHCGGGERTLDRFDLVTAIVNWAEQGDAPKSVVATSAAQPGVSRPLCPYPAHAQYGGSGSLADAASYACRE